MSSRGPLERAYLAVIAAFVLVFTLLIVGVVIKDDEEPTGSDRDEEVINVEK